MKEIIQHGCIAFSIFIGLCVISGGMVNIRYIDGGATFKDYVGAFIALVLLIIGFIVCTVLFVLLYIPFELGFRYLIGG